MTSLQTASRHSDVLLVSPVGLSRGWVPAGILVLRMGLRRSGVSSDAVVMSVRFSARLNSDPVLRMIDETVGEWGYAFHEAYFAALLFRHIDPTTFIARLVQLRSQRRDIYGGFNVVPYESMRNGAANEVDPYTLDNISRYCGLLARYVAEEVRTLSSAPYRAVFFSCNCAQLVSALYMAKLIRETWPTQPVIAVGGAALTQENSRRLGGLCPHIDHFLPGPADGRCLNVLMARGVPVTMAPDDPFRSELRCMQTHTDDGLLDPGVIEVLRDDIRWPVWQSWGCSWAKCRFCVEKPNLFRLRNVRTTIEDMVVIHELRSAQQ